ncbi:hypothetical protein NLI96_g3113 [Meripilus lineatus]|uniref:Peptidase metallopeptidase domain-containing protein n=1 Tax=Meripilus lineatus TaxID=2056292 RepID=A0AAD5YL79_9APHY|nr:hypothetical protein NLI96_g3113 [Physisporinus lineatus]
MSSRQESHTLFYQEPSMASLKRRLWAQEASIDIIFLDGTPAQQSKVMRGFEEWGHYVNLKFTQAPCADLGIQISFSGKCSTSRVGTWCLHVTRGTPAMTFSEIDGENSDWTDDERGTILREVGHALGFAHEHHNPDCKEILTSKQGSISKDDAKTQDRSEEVMNVNVTNVSDEMTMKTHTVFDHASIMGYPIDAPCDDQEIITPSGTELSSFDKAFAMAHYPRLIPHRDTPEWTIEHAFTVLGVPEDTQNQILRSTNPKTIFRSFDAWNKKRIKQVRNAQKQAEGDEGHDTIG